MTVIDLGLAGTRPGEPARHRWTRRHYRWVWVLALVVIAPLVGTVASAVPVAPLQRTGAVPAALLQSFQLFDDGLYVEDGREPIGGNVSVSAYDLSGTKRWTRRVSGAAAETTVYETSRQALIEAADIDGATAFIAADRSTGRQLWDGQDMWGMGEPSVLDVDRRGRLLVDVRDPRGTGGVVHWLDTGTGRDLWTVPLSSGWSVDTGMDASGMDAGDVDAGAVDIGAADAGPAGTAPAGVLWIVGPAGQLVAVTLDDTGTRRAVPLSGLPDTADLLDRSVTVGVGAIVVTDESDQATVVHTYDATSYRPRWTRTIDGSASIQSCGPDLCQLGNEVLVVLDPKTGVALWSTGGVAVHPFWWQLVMEPFVAPWFGSPAVVDARTGRVLINLSTWQIATIAHGRTMLLMQELAGHSGEWLGRLDAGSRTVSILGRMPGLSTTCAMTTIHLACQRADGTIVMWRMNR